MGTKVLRITSVLILASEGGLSGLVCLHAKHNESGEIRCGVLSIVRVVDARLQEGGDAMTAIGAITICLLVITLGQLAWSLATWSDPCRELRTKGRKR
jgi:hypothetical protein